jgi:hypothetical protein
MYNVTLRRVRESLLPWKSNRYICVCACVSAYGRLCVPCSVSVCTRVRAYSLAYPAYNAYAPYCDVICGLYGSTIFFDIIS